MCQVGCDVGEVFVIVVNLFNLLIIVLGGSIVCVGEYFFVGVCEVVYCWLILFVIQYFVIVQFQVGDCVVVLGVVIMVVCEVFFFVSVDGYVVVKVC